MSHHRDGDLSHHALEKAKSQSERAEDIAYTLNHALVCTATDFIDPVVGNLTQTYLGKRFSLENTPTTPASGHLKQWAIGEVVGDFGAVPVTIAVQRCFPGFMAGLRQLAEPVVGELFHKGAERSAKRWAASHGVSTDSPEYQQRVNTIYQHEMQHIPQALMWTASSITLNISTQRLLGNRAPLWHLLAGKTAGASITAGLLLGTRSFAPGFARKCDHWTSEHIFLPATRAASHLLGIRPPATTNWAERTTRTDDSPSSLLR